MNKKTVLIVDDDKLLREELAKDLKRSFFNVLEASDGMTALELINEEKVDIMLLDVKLPDMDGLELLKRVKRQRPDCEVIVITGFGSEDIAIQSLREGAIDYLEKPIKIDDLTAAVGRAHEKVSQREAVPYKGVILVIDDDEEVLKRLKIFLEKEEFSVFTSSGGQEGLDIIEQNKIDVIISDIKMKDMNGIEVLQKAKGIYRDIEGIMVTGYTDGELAIQSLRAGAMDYIHKPVNLDELLLSINRAIENITLHRNRLYRGRETKIASEIISRMNEELEKMIEERSLQLNQTQAQLFQTSKLATLGEMATGLAHEMNQPLGGIALITTNLRKLLEKGKLSNEELETGLNDIDLSIKRMAKVIQHIRTFARQDTLKFVEVEVSSTIDSAMSLLNEQMRLHDIEVTLEIVPDLPKVIGEPYQLEQVWINLISNARDALDERKRQGKLDGPEKTKYQKRLCISVRPDADTKYIIIGFEDNGVGISREQREKVFEPFFTTKEVGRGSGLGLSISYGIIENHKGKILVEGKKDGGTSVKVKLPVQKPEDNDG